MGKMLETLKLGEGRRAAGTPEPLPPARESVVDWEIEAEVPFVEVGGPNRKVEGSPSAVLKHPPQATQPPHNPPTPAEAKAAVAEPAVSAAAKTVALTEAKPMLVAFESYPRKAVPVSIAPEIIAYHQPDHAISKEYAQLLDKMLRALKTPHSGVVLLIGLKPQIGASTVLLNLAGVAALQNRRVIVVDANFVRPGLAQRFGCPGACGLEEVLEGTIALDQALLPTPIPSLHLLATGSTIDGGEYLTADAMTWLVGLLRDRFDLILVDGPTLDDTADVATQAPHADAVYLVVPQGEPASAHRTTAQTISRMGGRLCGLIHTHFEM